MLSISIWLAAGASILNAQAMSGETFFNALVEVSGHAISGIMVIKNDVQDENRCRILFTTIAGPKLMDMHITRDDCEILYVTKKLRKKFILRLFQKDFALVSGLYLSDRNKDCAADSCSVKLSKKKSAHYLYDAQNRIVRAEYRGRGKPLFAAVYTYNNKDNPESIILQHYNFRMKITLTAINSTCTD
ncbi:MAG: hypothetical protein LBK96_02550 [Prevotellaceae bacterium]|nr:hypothetical protein [Prevotellaceae bacterium]